MKPTVKAMPVEMTHDMIEASYMCLAQIAPNTSPERLKRIVAQVWRQAAEVAAMPKQGGLTKKQQRLHEVIADFIQENGVSPTYEEIGQLLGMKNRGDVFRMVKVLIRKGVVRTTTSQRSISLVVQPGEPIPQKKFYPGLPKVTKP